MQERPLSEGGRVASTLRALTPEDSVTDGGEALAWAGPPIPRGVEMNHLLASDFERWSELYAPRHLRAFMGAIATVRAMDRPPEIRDRLAVAVFGCCEMPAYLCRWDRYHPNRAPRNVVSGCRRRLRIPYRLELCRTLPCPLLQGVARGLG